MTLRAMLLALYRKAASQNGFDKTKPHRIEIPADQRRSLRYEAAGTMLRSVAEAREAKVETDDEENALWAIINTNEVDRHGTIVDPAGCVLDNFVRNPVLLAFHGYDAKIGDRTIGEVPVIRKSDTQIEAKVRFFGSEHAAPIAEMYRKKEMRGFSIGFSPITVDVVMVEGRTVLKFVKWELVELSAVAVPSNPSALARDVKAGTVKFPSTLVTKHFNAICECVARNDDPENLLCRVVDVELPDPHAAVVASNDTSLASRSVSESDPLGLGHLANFAAQGGTRQTDPATISANAPAAGADCGCGPTSTITTAAATLNDVRQAATMGGGGPAITITSTVGTPAPGAVATAEAEVIRSAEDVVRERLTQFITAADLGGMTPEIRQAFAKLVPGVEIPTAPTAEQRQAYDWVAPWSMAHECRTAHPDMLAFMAAGSKEVDGQMVRFFVHHRAQDGAVSVPSLLACMRELIGETQDLTVEQKGDAWDHLGGHYRELGIPVPPAEAHSAAQCYDLALRGIVTHFHEGQHYLFDHAEQANNRVNPVFRNIATGDLVAFDPPRVGRLTDYRAWGRRDLPEPSGNEALLERLVQTEERLADLLQVREGKKFSQATRTQITRTADALTDLGRSLATVADQLVATVDGLRSMLDDGSSNDDDGGRGVSGRAQSVAGSDPSGVGIVTADGDDGVEEFARDIVSRAAQVLDGNRGEVVKTRRARLAAGV